MRLPLLLAIALLAIVAASAAVADDCGNCLTDANLRHRNYFQATAISSGGAYLAASGSTIMVEAVTIAGGPVGAVLAAATAVALFAVQEWNTRDADCARVCSRDRYIEYWGEDPEGRKYTKVHQFKGRSHCIITGKVGFATGSSGDEAKTNAVKACVTAGGILSCCELDQNVIGEQDVWQQQGPAPAPEPKTGPF
jgi:hypothetical protein